MTHPHKPRRRQRAMAARQALRLCEAELFTPTWDGSELLPSSPAIRRGAARISAPATKAALRAAGLPPRTAAALRSRLRLSPEPETRP